MSEYETEEQKERRNRRLAFEDERAEQQAAEDKAARELFANRVHAMACAVAQGRLACNATSFPDAIAGEAIETATAVYKEMEKYK